MDPLIPTDGNGWHVDPSNNDAVLLRRNAVTARLMASGGVRGPVAITGAVNATGAVTGASVGATSAVTGASGAFSGGASVGATGSLLKTRKTTLTAAQIKALAGTPIAVIPAAVGKMFQVLGAQWTLNAGTEVLAEPTAPDDLALRYVNGAGSDTVTKPDSGALMVSAVDAYAISIPVLVEGIVAAAAVGVPVVVCNTGDDLTGNASNDATLDVVVTYLEHTV